MPGTQPVKAECETECVISKLLVPCSVYVCVYVWLCALIPGSVVTWGLKACPGVMLVHLHHYTLKDIFMPLYYRWGNWGIDWLNLLLPKLVRCRIKIQVHVSLKPTYLSGKPYVPLYQVPKRAPGDTIMEMAMRLLHTDFLRHLLSWGGGAKCTSS